jgi:hypothetical protein
MTNVKTKLTLVCVDFFLSCVLGKLLCFELLKRVKVIYKF